MSRWFQKEIRLNERRRGCHLVHSEIVNQIPELKNFKVGMANFFLKHTSASLMINENYDSDVQKDMEMGLNKIVPESFPYIHTAEGPDDMPGHLKSGIVGVSLNVPITNGKLNLGTWQGIYLCEHRNSGGSRRLVITLQGQEK
ncbi:uncharacterized protein BX663DRAFT_493198 [Cokeromyces recurvatus]|uniref:uncharacterized protein n=1 Tax=Cokeromyces recurvatus TaxID=90255 RepID=UPI0022203F80|nr:uncharacterized protein BX663DRAFT_493198 [Cokeromyces recurvatus]KAI7908159.1 hypothetical protein BX663DRAFT_493198 [Cokeromyces recurvatus]